MMWSFRVQAWARSGRGGCAGEAVDGQVCPSTRHVHGRTESRPPQGRLRRRLRRWPCGPSLTRARLGRVGCGAFWTAGGGGWSDAVGAGWRSVPVAVVSLGAAADGVGADRASGPVVWRGLSVTPSICAQAAAGGGQGGGERPQGRSGPWQAAENGNGRGCEDHRSFPTVRSPGEGRPPTLGGRFGTAGLGCFMPAKPRHPSSVLQRRKAPSRG